MVRHRKTLVAALSACADGVERPRARRFLLGLSADELQFIAEFFGACILECSEDLSRVTSAVQALHTMESPYRSDRENKMILLREFLCRSGRQASDAIAG
jgi:hypothetical protein